MTLGTPPFVISLPEKAKKPICMTVCTKGEIQGREGEGGDHPSTSPTRERMKDRSKSSGARSTTLYRQRQRERSSQARLSTKLRVEVLALKTISLQAFHMLQRITTTPARHTSNWRGRGPGGPRPRSARQGLGHPSGTRSSLRPGSRRTSV
jgi:hypothetical protein